MTHAHTFRKLAMPIAALAAALALTSCGTGSDAVHDTSSRGGPSAGAAAAAGAPVAGVMSGWLVGWGEPVPDTTGESDMSGMSGMGEQTGGMMSAGQMTDLGAATGPAFDRMFREMMIEHHQGAVAMAKDALTQGTNPEVKKLAQAVIDGQSAQIAEMRSSL